MSRGLDAYVCVGVVWRVFVRAGLRTFYFRIALCLVKHLFRDSVYSECYSWWSVSVVIYLVLLCVTRQEGVLQRAAGSRVGSSGSAFEKAFCNGDTGNG